jgi:hypothetical protein
MTTRITRTLWMSARTAPRKPPACKSIPRAITAKKTIGRTEQEEREDRLLDQAIASTRNIAAARKAGKDDHPASWGGVKPVWAQS